MIAVSPRIKGWIAVALVALVLVASRIPFLDAGYGVNGDAWRVARAAKNIALTGQYEASRLPGYPVHEIVSSWLWRGGPWALNGASALLSMAAVAALAAFAGRVGLRDRVLAALALAMTPVFYISSVTSKDYVWGLALVWIALVAALRGRALLAGVFVGLAAGCRLTSLAMFAPVLMVLLGAIEARQRIRKAVFLALACAATTALVFWPVWARYGAGFFTFYEKHGRPDWWTILHRGTVEVWGTLGVIGFLVAAVAAVLWRIRNREQPSPLARQQPGNRLVVPALLVTVAIYLAAYLRLPDQAGYLLPVIPATILLAGLYLPRLCFRILCLGLLVAPFVDPWTPKQWAGPIFMDRQERIQTMENIRNFVQFSRTLPDKSVILVGGWEPQIGVLFPEAASGRIVYVYLLSEEQLKATLEGGFTVYYLPAIRAFNASVYGIDVATFGARDLRAIYEERVRVQPRPK